MNYASTIKGRDSNGELLRILAMLMIVMHHWVVHAFYPAVLTLDIAGQPWDHPLLLGFHCFFYIGVNCFVLLSGWYSIRLKTRSVINLWSICFFYALVSFFVVVGYRIWRDLSFPWRMLLPVAMPFSHTPCWFIHCYVALLLLSPLLNAGLDHLNRKQYVWMLVWISVMNIWFGYFCRVSQINPSGYTVLQFIWLYVIGAFIHRNYSDEWHRNHRWHYLWLYTGCALLWGVFSCLKAYHLLGVFDSLWHPFTYCNPFVLFSSIGFFLFVMSFQFKCLTINWMATSVLGAYLLQDALFPYHRLQAFTENWSSLTKLLALPLFTICWVAAIILLDRIRLGISTPLWNWYEKHLEKLSPSNS
jgi:hypothetical protein